MLVGRVDAEWGVVLCWRGVTRKCACVRAYCRWPQAASLLPECKEVTAASQEWKNRDLNPGRLKSMLLTMTRCCPSATLLYTDSYTGCAGPLFWILANTFISKIGPRSPLLILRLFDCGTFPFFLFSTSGG